MHKRKQLILFSLILSVGLLGGCGGSKAESEAKDSSEIVISASSEEVGTKIAAESESVEAMSAISSVSEDTNEENGGETIVTQYFTVTVPVGWKEKVECSEDIINGDDTSYAVDFYDKACMDAGVGGHLFGIYLCSSYTDYTTMPDYQYLGTVTGSDGTEYSLIAVFPTDVQFDEEHQEKYTELSNAAQSIISSVQMKDGYTFTPSSDGDQSAAAECSQFTFANIYADYLGDDFNEDCTRYNWTASAEGGMWESLGIRYDAGDGVQYVGVSDPVGNMQYFGVKDGIIVAHIEPVNDQNLAMKDFNDLPLNEEPYFSEVPDDQGWSTYVYQINNGYQAYFVIHYGDDTPWYDDYVMYIVSVTDKAYCSRIP